MSVGNLKDKLEDNEIDLSLCNLTTIPVAELADIPEATHLDLSCNLFVSLPDSFCFLTHLVKVDLSKNKLSALPADIGRLVNLEHLDLLGNELVMLPPSFCQLRSLKWLDLKGNPLDPVLRERTGDCLDRKQCQECARNVLQYMREMIQKKEKDDQKWKKGLRSVWCLSKLPVFITMGLILIVGTLGFGYGSVKKRLCLGVVNPICAHLQKVIDRASQLVMPSLMVIYDFFPCVDDVVDN